MPEADVFQALSDMVKSVQIKQDLVVVIMVLSIGLKVIFNKSFENFLRFSELLKDYQCFSAFVPCHHFSTSLQAFGSQTLLSIY